ncbi:hypothetical protein KM043_014566 [Ampulex compressa]|nr:hypothetical protein KM043_014566 [Ampulex compressa]
MAIKVISCVALLLYIFIRSPTLAEEGPNNVTKCQFGKISRKQVNAEPLNGVCLRDIVLHLSEVLRSIADKELGVAFFHNFLEKLEFANISNNLDVRLNVLADKFDTKLESYLNLIKQSSSIIEPLLSKKHEYHQGSIGLDIMQNTVSDICSQIITALASNLRIQEWKNLHILPMSYPSTMCGPPSLAHNVGPLLLFQCCPKKNVVLLLEHGMFMSEGDLALAQITAKTIIDMLSETDYVTVVGLSNNGFIHCKDGLMRATDINKIQLARYIDSITRTDYNHTIDLDDIKLPDTARDEIVFIHLTNNLKTAKSTRQIFDLISSRQVKGYLKTVLILSDQEPHVNIKQSLNDENTIILPTQNILGYEIAKLFHGLNCTDEHKKDYYLSDPYFEPYSKSMVLSVGQITNITLLSLDVKLRDFLDDITYFNAGPNIYAILFDSKGIIWIHKDFPRVDVMLDQPFKVYLSDIENIEHTTVTTMIEQSQGILSVKTKLGEEKQYRWKHLIYTDLIVCLVSPSSEGLLPVAKLISTLPTNILHHRLDLLPHTIIDKNMLCSEQNKIMTLSTGVVYLSPWCFQSPMQQFKLLETGSSVTVQSYMAYIKDLTGLLANPGLHQSVRPDVVTLAQILEHFKKRHMDNSVNKFVVRRYVTGTVSGILEIYPGIIIDSGFDPKRRMWYGKALEHPGKVILTPPYLDAGGSGYVITLSHIVQHKIESRNDHAIGIVSMDVTMGYVARLLMNMFPFCSEPTVKCFLMDDKGYLVSHPSLLEPVVQRYYQFNTSLEEVLTNIVHGEHCVKYQVAAIPDTNVFLGIVNMTCNLLTAFCPCSTMDRSCLNCKRMEQTECECPCECSLYSSNCVQHNINDLEPCSAPYEQASSMQSFWTHTSHLEPCHSMNCKVYNSERECLGIVGCQWCHMDSDGETPLQNPFCSDMSMCFRGVFGSFIPFSDGTYNSQSTEEISIREWPSVGPVAGGILAFLLILGVTLFCYRLRSVHSGLEHQCLHLHASPDTLRMTHLEGDPEPAELDQMKHNLDSLIRDGIVPVSPYRVSTNYRRPPGGDSDHGYSTMTPHDDSEQQTFVEPLLVVSSNTKPELKRSSVCLPSPITNIESPHHVLAPVTVHCNMEMNYC